MTKNKYKPKSGIIEIYWWEMPKYDFNEFVGIIKTLGDASPSVQYIKNGIHHRDFGPCEDCELCDNKKKELCNKPGPAIYYHDGTKEYRIDGELHRDVGPAYIDDRNGEVFYHVCSVALTREQFELYYMLKYKKEYKGQ